MTRRDGLGNTPLETAFLHGNFDACELLEKWIAAHGRVGAAAQRDLLSHASGQDRALGRSMGLAGGGLYDRMLPQGKGAGGGPPPAPQQSGPTTVNHVQTQAVPWSTAGYGMRSEAVILDVEDEVNVAMFLLQPGAGVVFGTKLGKVRLLGAGTWQAR